MKAMLLAAGLGTRLRPLTDDRPKAMVEVAGRPLIVHTIERLRAAGVLDLVVNLHHHPDSVTGRLGDGADLGVSIRYSPEDDLLGTAGAVARAAPMLAGGAFLVVYSDNLVECDLAAFLEAHRRSGAVMTIALHWREDVSASGVATVDEAGRIEAFVEKPPPGTEPSHWVNAGLYACEPEVLERIPAEGASDFGRDVIPAMLAAGDRIAAYRMAPPERLLWIDTHEDLARTERELAAGTAR